jgi:hypothetical protein
VSDIKIQHVPNDSPLHAIPDAVKRLIAAAQNNTFERAFRTSAELCGKALADLKLNIPTPAELKDQPPSFLGDKESKELIAYFDDVAKKSGIPEQAVSALASSMAHRVQLLRAFHEADEVIRVTCEKVIEVVEGFPKTADDIRCGNNPGDVLDPYILAAAQVLMCSGDFEKTISAGVAHKVMMIIEGLLGHLHEDVIGAMRGNVRIPEPRGEDQETLDPATNPFPGADILQPPTSDRRIRFFQVKSKTGSAKGGDGRRLGEQLVRLVTKYGGEAFYVALIGNTLKGHRSMTGVKKAAPDAVVLVGEASFRELTGSNVGPQLLLRLYQSAFEVAAKKTGYSLEEIVNSIFHAFRERAEKYGDCFLETVLHDAIAGPASQQDSRQYQPSRSRKRNGDEDAG